MGVSVSGCEGGCGCGANQVKGSILQSVLSFLCTCVGHEEKGLHILPHTHSLALQEVEEEEDHCSCREGALCSGQLAGRGLGGAGRGLSGVGQGQGGAGRGLGGGGDDSPNSPPVTNCRKRGVVWSQGCGQSH